MSIGLTIKLTCGNIDQSGLLGYKFPEVMIQNESSDDDSIYFFLSETIDILI